MNMKKVSASMPLPAHSVSRILSIIGYLEIENNDDVTLELN